MVFFFGKNPLGRAHSSAVADAVTGIDGGNRFWSESSSIRTSDAYVKVELPSVWIPMLLAVQDLQIPFPTKQSNNEATMEDLCSS